ncbi:hypothetical protein FNF28_05249 [Cafeteria roenbergensis]|uniref:FAD-binding FR-type domain-containing protein n=1 Tax=Cafeteria roenbergensis TaxID=33653 RepID=A0A5A8D5V8_CAFRO|nr:hypothetical protein FNF28_05249 [Cafeteria roenbergensis]
MILTMHRPLAGCLLRVPCLAARVPVEAVKKAHKCAAWATVIWTLVHVGGHYRNFTVLASLPARAVLANMGLEGCIGRPEADPRCWTLPPAVLAAGALAGNATAPTAELQSDLRVSAAEWLLESVPGATGHAMLAAMAAAVPLAACPAVRIRCHELFSRSHVALFIVMAVCLSLHGQGSWLDVSRWYVMALPCLLVLARMAAQCALPLTQQAAVVSAIVDDSGVARLELVIRRAACARPVARAAGALGLPWTLDPAQHRPLRALPGQFVLLRLPSLSGLQWHPFSVSSASADDVLVLHVRPQGDLTRRIVEELCLSADEVDAGARVVHQGADGGFAPQGKAPSGRCPAARLWRPVPVQLSGPFSAGAQLCLSSAFEDGGVFLAAAGVGATPFVSALRELHAAFDGGGTAAGDGLQANTPAWLPHSVWHGTPRLPRHVTFVWVVPTVAKAAWGLPTLRDVVTSYATRMRETVTVGVFACGPPPMAKQLAQACRAISDEEPCSCGFRSRRAGKGDARRPSGMASTAGSRRPARGRPAFVANPLAAGSCAHPPSDNELLDRKRLVRFTLVKERFW